MNIAKTRSSVMAVFITGLVMSLPTTALAQDDEAIEEIVVTGYKASILAAREAKRMSEAISDSIMSEDIGKSTDENIADALSRVTGVSLQSTDGIGQTVTVRGLNPNLNVVSLNGVQLGSGSDGSDVNLSAFSADLVSQIEVVKTSSANQNEGSLGGAVNLTTTRPLDRKADRTTGELQWRSTDFDGDNDYKFSGALSRKLMDERLGISVGVNVDNQFRRSDFYQTFDWRLERYADPTSLQTGETIPGNYYAVAPRFSNQRVDALDIETIGTNVVLQFQPSEESEVWLDVSYGKAKKTQDIYQFQEKNWHRGADRPIAGSAIVDEDTQTYIFTLSERGVGFQQTRHRELEDETLATTLGGELIRGPWTFEARLNHHKLNADIPVWNQANFQSPIGAPASEVPLGFSCGVMVDPATNQPVESGGVVVGARDQCGILFGSWFDPINNPDGGPRLGQVRINGRNVNDETTSFFFDVDREVEFGPFSSIEFGIKYTDRNKDRFENNVGISVSNTESPPETQMPISAFSEPFPFSDPWLGGEAASGQVTNWPVPDLALIWAEIFPSGLPATSANPLNTWDITEEVSAAYLQANFQAMGGLLYGNIGLRWVDTQINANGTSGIQFRSPLPTYFEIELTDEYCDTIAGQVCNVETPVSEEHDYAELLPSFNLNYALREDMLLRFAASKTMARPQFDHLRPNGNLNIASFTESTFRGGNPLLKPLISTNLDVSWEWYYGDSNMLAAALFYKDIEDFTFASTFDRQYINPFTGECFQDEQVGTEGPWDCDEITTFANINGGKAEILGLELTYQQTLEHLSGWASGLGFLLNYTYADSEGDYDPATGADDPYDGFPFINTSEHTYNATAFWDGEKLQARLAYNWRTAYLITPQANDMATWADPTGSLDASFTFQINDNVALTGNAVNLTDEAPRLFQTVARSNRDTVVPEGNLFENSIYEGRTHQVNYYGRTYRLGVRVTF